MQFHIFTRTAKKVKFIQTFVVFLRIMRTLYIFIVPIEAQVSDV